MTDDETRETNSSEDSPAGPLAGERLAEARREKQISVAEIAKELHIDEHKVRALERNEFEVLGAPVFAKGHLRKYAQLVGVGVDDVLADYYSLNRSVGMPPLVGRQRPSSRDINLGRWLVVLLLLAAAGIAWWWFFEREVPTPRAPVAETGRVSLPATPTGDPAPETTTPGTGSGAAPDLATPAESGSAAPSDAVSGSPAEAAAPPPARPVPVAAGDMRLSLAFTGDCWTEITDAAGDRLFFGLGSEGRTVDVSGTPPLSVMFGNADNVSVEVDGDDYPIPPGSRRGRIARFTIPSS